MGASQNWVLKFVQNRVGLRGLSAHFKNKRGRKILSHSFWVESVWAGRRYVAARLSISVIGRNWEGASSQVLPNIAELRIESDR